MRESKKFLGYYNYTVVLTYAGAMMGFAGMVMAVEHQYLAAVICLMVAGICDMFDGAVAASKARGRDEKRFGIQIDSLSDLLGFGVLPAILVYIMSGGTLPAFIAGGFYVLCALIRLSYFNVLEEKRQELGEGKRTFYLGLPVTAIAILFPACYIIQNGWFPELYKIYTVLLFAAGTAFLLPVKIKKPYHTGKAGIILMGIVEFIMLL